MKVTPFLLLKRSAIDRMTQQASTVLDRWSQAWNVLPDKAAACSAVTGEHGELAAAQGWQCRSLGTGASVWLCMPAGLERSLGQLLFGVNEMDATSEKHVPSPIASSIAQDALEELAADLIQVLTNRQLDLVRTTPPAAFPAHLFRPGSGAVLCSIRLADKTIRLIFPAGAIPFELPLPKSASTRPALSTLQRALANVPIKLSVEVSQAELTLGHLRTLCVGDVLFLPTGIDQAMRVTGPGGTMVCQAHLGTQDGFHAIELIK